MKKKVKRYIHLVVWVLALLGVGYLMGGITESSLSDWYVSLPHSKLTPPNYVFGIVWTILYVMIAIGGWLIWEAEKFEGQSTVKHVFVLQLFLNWTWSPLFFYYRQINTALACIVAIFILVGYIILQCWNNLRLVSILLLPYLIWLGFAAYLNAVIVYHINGFG